MALRTSNACLVWFVAATLLSACTFPVTQDTPDVALTPDPPAQAGRDTVLIVMPVVSATAELRHALISELSPLLNLRTAAIENLSVTKLAREMDRSRPAAVVLIDNRSVSLYRQVQAQRAAGNDPPALVLMAAFAEESARSIRNASVISYDVPGVTSVVALRKLIDRPVRRVGVVYRRPFVHFIERNRKLAEVENVELVTVPVDARPSTNDVAWALSRLLDGERPVDALWVLNDNVLLTSALLRDAWLPMTHRHRPPVIVGVEALVNRSLDFGSLAVLPDLNALGLQAAQHLISLSERGWQAKAAVEPPISVVTVADAAQLEEFSSVRAQALEVIDRVVR